MGFESVAEINTSYREGRTRIFSWRKVPTQTTALGIWFDLSMSPGNPIPQYYAASPNTSRRLSQTDDGGIFHGSAVSPATLHLHKIQAFTTTTTAVPLPMILMDYLLYYPFIDMGSTESQAMSVGSVLGVPQTIPRYTTGAGVQIMAVEVAAQIGGSTFFVTYTNQDGTPGRVTPTMTCNTQTATGTIITSGVGVGLAGPFLPLQSPDTGVRSIESVQFLTTDVGLITLVLVKPLASTMIYDITAASEKDWVVTTQTMPVIVDDAYLNFIVYPSGTLASAPILGLVEFVFTG